MESVAHNKLPLIFDDNVTLSDQGRVQKFPWKLEWRFTGVHIHERSYCEKPVMKWWKQMLSNSSLQ
jgi:aryl carrier-like protein